MTGEGKAGEKSGWFMPARHRRMGNLCRAWEEASPLLAHHRPDLFSCPSPRPPPPPPQCLTAPFSTKAATFARSPGHSFPRRNPRDG